jgi:predicted small lipoprotein YifL
VGGATLVVPITGFQEQDMKTTVKSAFALCMLLAALAGCQRNDPASAAGPAEKAGQKLDQAAVKAAEEVNKLAEKAGKGMEKAGESMQNAAREAKAKNGEK